MADVLWLGPSEDSLTAVRAPDTLTITLQDWDSASTTRTASGKMVRTVIRGGDNNVRKLALSWALLGCGGENPCRPGETHVCILQIP